ncbi:MAG TPA: hypothetical protein VM925_37070 [Labilithrix sp.]|nr:hypothetical protein [Labilithrix sp.]
MITAISATLLLSLGSANCYSPTQVTVALSTDLDCAEGPRTRIYKGLPSKYETAPEAEVTTCNPSVGEAQIGTLVFVPSGSSDSAASVRVVLARGGKAPAECDSDPANCIIATRSFSFVEHAARNVPIRLLRDCLGTKCGEGETCVAGGRCISNRVECTGDDCGLPGEPPPDGTRPPNDGGSIDTGRPPLDGDVLRDGSVDVDADEPDVIVDVPACVPAGGSDIIATTTDMPVHTGTGTTHHFWIADNTPIDVKVMSVPKDGGTATSIYDGIAPVQGVDEAPFGLAASGNTAVVAYGNGSSTASVWNGTLYSAPSGMTKVSAVASRGPGRIALAGTNGTVQERTAASPFKSVLSANAVSLAADPSFYWAATASGITRIDTAPGTPATIAVAGAPPNALLATGTNDVVHAAAKESAKTTWGIWRVSNAGSPSVEPLVTGRAAVTSLASDATHVYWTESDELWRVASGGGAAQKIFAQAGVALDRVTVDADCVYFWTKRSVGPAALRRGPRKPFATISAGP